MMSCGSRVLPAVGNFASTSAIRSARTSQIVGGEAWPRAISLTSSGMYACCITLPQPMMPTETVSAMTLLELVPNSGRLCPANVPLADQLCQI